MFVKSNPRQQHRLAFTLVELLVSMALIVFIMSILSAAFAAASKTFRDLKAAGDLAEQLRSATMLMRRDLAAPHFDPTTKKLSDANFWTSNPSSIYPNTITSTTTTIGGPPLFGFIRIFQWPEAAIPGGLVQQPSQGAIQGPTGIPPPLAWQPPPGEIPTYVNTQAMLHFTVVLPGLQPYDFFSTAVQDPTNPLFNNPPSPLFNNPPSSQLNQDRRFQQSATAMFKSQFAEVAWWLTKTFNPDGTPATTVADPITFPGTAPQQLWTLHRRQRLLWPESTTASITSGAGFTYDEVSTPNVGGAVPVGTVPVNRMSEITIPAFRLGMDIDPTNPFQAGAWTPNPPGYYATTPAGLFQTGTTYPSYTLTPSGTITPAPLDIVVNNVLSFSVRVLVSGDTIFRDLSDLNLQPYSTNGASPNMGNNNPLFNTATNPGKPPTGPWVFDTWSQLTVGKYDYGNPTAGWSSQGNPTSIPMYQNKNTGQLIRIMAVQITLRLYDFKTQLTRQVTLVQNM